MNVCSKCEKKQGYFYICKYCEGRFCKAHQHPNSHNCKSRTKETETYISSDVIQTKEFVYYPNPRIIKAIEIIKSRERMQI